MSNYDITENMNDWEYAMYNMRRKRQDRVNALVKKYGYPVNENNLLPEDYYEYDLLKSDLEAMEKTSAQTSKSMPHGSSLDDEDMERNAQKLKEQNPYAASSTQTSTANNNAEDEQAEALRKIREDQEKSEENNSQPKESNDIQQAKTTLASLGYYRGKIDNMATPGLTKAMNDFAQDHQMNEQTINKSLNGITEKLKSVKTPARLDFDGKYLRFIRDGKLVLVLNAMSGNPDYQNRKYQNVRDKGPLPEGSYRVKQDKIQNMDLENAFYGAAKLIGIKKGTFPGSYYSWGKTRVWLEPFSSNNMHGRNNFTIHGGATMGSAGCIDIPGHTKEFFDVLRKYGKDIILNVHYDKEKLQ